MNMGLLTLSMSDLKGMDNNIVDLMCEIKQWENRKKREASG